MTSLITCPTLFVLGKKQTNNKPQRPLIRIFGDKNTSVFKNKLDEIRWAELEDIEEYNQAFTWFTIKINKAFNESFPLIKLSIKKSKDKKWLTPGLLIRIRHYHKLYKQFINNPTLARKVRYTRYKSILTTTCRQAEDMHYSNLIEYSKQSVKKTMECIRTNNKPTQGKKVQ